MRHASRIVQEIGILVVKGLFLGFLLGGVALWAAIAAAPFGAA
ncbi:hypothetical protein J155_01181 [Xanthomonas citri pv. citri]|uniref:Uncharacterized protein n=1 Tax=Xanthomonas citri pv. citri TaxID=611301 RepID=A0A0U5FBD9_XANCI|nr:hypothetical protein J151_01183 [Xanthomonas citri subsp. citri A306]AJY81175.1 hypothetical protein J159_01180 [Xanthomonas citri pv. citri]AJY85597.1 hypothetical protein J158_01180 [Xanthomonas citri subsp. citri UI6]AJY90020.1 hypothetical protein J169_01179 [Xanthomonas citri pv. citri]AJY94491.1 hypothetical protein J164_01179 [Xanthomonas citri pv. citri]